MLSVSRLRPADESRFSGKFMTTNDTIRLDSPAFKELTKTTEFYKQVRNEVGKKLLYEVQLHDPIVVEDKVDDVVLGRILDHIHRVWTRLGAEEPHWSVVSTADFKPARIQDTIGRFHETGRAEAANLSRLLARVGLAVPRPATALEYGCGVGRVTRWLAPLFDRVIGVDISANHIAEARKYLSAEGVANTEFTHISRVSQIDELPGFDFIYSKIVLQHNPPPVIARILDVLCSKLRPGGAGVIQIPTYAAGYAFRAKEYLEKMDKIAGMEMHVLPQPAVFGILDTHGCLPIEVSRDHLTTVDYVSTTFVFRKRT